MASTTENTTATKNMDNQHICLDTCECHKINWNFKTFIHTLKSTGEKLNSENGICCQSKVNEGYWTHEQYEERCIVMDKHQEILRTIERSKRD